MEHIDPRVRQFWRKKIYLTKTYFFLSKTSSSSRVSCSSSSSLSPTEQHCKGPPGGVVSHCPTECPVALLPARARCTWFLLFRNRPPYFFTNYFSSPSLFFLLFPQAAEEQAVMLPPLSSPPHYLREPEFLHLLPIKNKIILLNFQRNFTWIYSLTVHVKMTRIFSVTGYSSNHWLPSD